MSLLGIDVDANIVAESDRLLCKLACIPTAYLTDNPIKEYLYYDTLHKAPGGVSSVSSGIIGYLSTYISSNSYIQVTKSGLRDIVARRNARSIACLNYIQVSVPNDSFESGTPNIDDQSNIPGTNPLNSYTVLPQYRRTLNILYG